MKNKFENVLVEAPTSEEIASLNAQQRAAIEFASFFESGVIYEFYGKMGDSMNFSNNRKEQAWNLIVNSEVVMTSGDANELVTKAASYL